MAWQTASAEFSVDEILDRVRQEYQDAEHYSDRGALVLTYSLQGAPQEERHPFSVAFARPQGEDLRIFDARLNRQRDQQVIAIFDPETNNVDQQVLVRTGVKFSDSLQLPDDPILQHFVSGRADLPLAAAPDLRAWLTPAPFVLANRLEDQPWFLGRRELLDPAFIDGNECFRIRIETKRGRVVAWIDRQQWLVRRLELPNSLLNDKLLEKAQVESRRLVAEFEAASWSADEDANRLSWQPAKATHKVRHFVSLPAPFPSELIGSKTRGFEVDELQGGLLSYASLRGNHTAWLWFSSDPICREPLGQFNEIAKRFQQKSNVRLFAVSTDLPSTQSSADLTQLMQQWQVDAAEVVRDWKQVGKTNFDIELLPTLVVLDTEGKIQYFKVIDDGQVATQLSAVLTRLEQGEDIANEMRSEYENYLKHYHRQLADAAWTEGGQALAIVPASYAPRKLPERFRLTLDWEIKDNAVVAPGNIAVASAAASSGAAGDTPEIAVLEGYQSLVFLSPDGQVRERRDLGRTKQDSYTQIRGQSVNGVTSWLVGSVLGTRLKLIQGAEPVRTLLDDPDSPIRDFVFIDSAEGRDPEIMVGYWEERGVERVDAQGKTIASLTSFPSIGCLAVTPPTQDGSAKLLGTQREGGLFRAEFNLQAAESTQLSGLEIAHVFTALRSQPGESLLCVLGLNEKGQIQARGLDDQWRVKWELPLSAEVFDRQVQFVQNGPLERGTLWAIARPDGTVHLITADGSSQDQFQVGAEITGLAIFAKAGETRLLVSTPAGVQCWRVELAREQARGSTGTELK